MSWKPIVNWLFSVNGQDLLVKVIWKTDTELAKSWGFAFSLLRRLKYRVNKGQTKDLGDCSGVEGQGHFNKLLSLVL